MNLDNYVCEGQMSIFDLDIWSGKTCPEPSVQTKEKTSDASLKKPRKSSIKMPLFLDLRGGQSGHHQDAFWVMGGVLPGAYMMHSFGECPKEENVSRLSQILEGQPHPKYCLSAKACQGILNRAERRGKELPELLRKTLLRQSLSKSDQVNQGGAKGSSSNMSEQGPCQPSITNPSCLNPWDVQSKHIQPENGKAEALYSGECRGGGGESYVMQEPVYCLQGNGIDRADTAGCNGKGWRENESYTLNTIDRPAIAYRKQGHPQNKEQGQGWERTDTNDTLNAFDSGEGRTPTLVRQTYQEQVGTIDCGIAKGTSNQLADQDMFIANGAVVRRLTPMECERLQGYPDGWVDIGEWTDSQGKFHKDADSPKYKALGNSIALPFWQWMAERMVRQYKTYRPTMASLFDGIGGFPLVFKRCGCEPVWASEIEEFPIAVTKKHFGEDGDIDKYIESAIPETTRGGKQCV